MGTPDIYVSAFVPRLSKHCLFSEPFDEAQGERNKRRRKKGRKKEGKIGANAPLLFFHVRVELVETLLRATTLKSRLSANGNRRGMEDKHWGAASSCSPCFFSSVACFALRFVRRKVVEVLRCIRQRRRIALQSVVEVRSACSTLRTSRVAITETYVLILASDSSSARAESKSSRT